MDRLIQVLSFSSLNIEEAVIESKLRSLITFLDFIVLMSKYYALAMLQFLLHLYDEVKINMRIRVLRKQSWYEIMFY